MIANTTYEKICDYLNSIQSYPKKDVKYFFFDECKKFIVNGEKLKSLPSEYQYLYSREEFYIHIDVLNKRIQYYAFDLKDYNSGEKINESSGTIQWCKDVEDSIYNFLALNIKELSTAIFPYSERPTTYQSTAYKPEPPYHGYQGSFSSGSSSSYYDGSTYKEREAFFDKVNTLIKSNKTAKATDYVFDSISKFDKEKKQATIDDIFRAISFDKLNIPTMISVLEATKGIEGLKDRNMFLGKVKDHLAKLKSSKVDIVMKQIG